VESPFDGRSSFSTAHSANRLRICRPSPTLDIWRAATLLMRQHGQDAEIVAARRIDNLAAREDCEGRAVWQRIRQAISELQAEPSAQAH